MDLINTVNNALQNPYLKSGLALFLVLYSSMSRPELPSMIMLLFDNAIFRLLVLTLIVFMSNGDVQVALLVAVAFTVTLNFLNEQKIAEGFAERFTDKH